MPFELGRPFGAPDEPDFQRRVLLTALQLLERTDGPILEDFPDAPPGPPADMEGWSCPINLPQPSGALSEADEMAKAIRAEAALLKPWYDEARKTLGNRHLDGLTDLDTDAQIAFLTGFYGDQTLPSPIEGAPVARAIKLVADDLRFFYFTAAMAKPGGVSDAKLVDWFYTETQAGEFYVRLKEKLAQSDNKGLSELALRAIVPNRQADLKSRRG